MNNHFTIIIVSVFILLTSCQSSPVSVEDLGSYNPDRVSEMELSVLSIDTNLDLTKIDSYKGNWGFYKDEGLIKELKIAPGIYSFEVLTSLESSILEINISIVVRIESEKRYRMVRRQQSMMISVDVVDVYTNKSIVLDLKSMRQDRADAHAVYYNFAVYPTEDRLGYTIELENKDSVIAFKPDMVFTMINKNSRESISGRFLFESGKVYLYETDLDSFSNEDFKNSNHAGIAQIIYEPVLCNGESVRLKYEKPMERRGSEEEFFIVEIVS